MQLPRRRWNYCHNRRKDVRTVQLSFADARYVAAFREALASTESWQVEMTEAPWHKRALNGATQPVPVRIGTGMPTGTATEKQSWYKLYSEDLF